jgi:hypothetical protein
MQEQGTQSTVLSFVKYVGCLRETVYQDPAHFILQGIVYILTI